MARPGELSVRALARSGIVLAGGLLLLVGLGDVIVGRSKIAQYEAMVVAADPAPRDPTELFPRANEAQERRALAVAKLGYYQLLFTAGQALSALGFVLLALGVLQVRARSFRMDPEELTS